MNCGLSLGIVVVFSFRGLLCNGCVDQIEIGSQVMIWSTGGSVTDMYIVWRYSVTSGHVNLTYTLR